MSAEPRSRTAPRAVRSSDVTRFHGVAAAVVAAAISVPAIAWAFLGGEQLSTDPPISRAHRAAEVECADCHAEPEPAAACGSCHEGRSTVRAGHVAARSNGTLGCTSCHDPHAPRGLIFGPDGTTTRVAPGLAERLPLDTAYRPSEPVYVPLISADTCASCHDLSAAYDPIAGCLSDGGADGSRPVVCFDEHQRGDTVHAAEGSTVTRDAAWEAARAALQGASGPVEGAEGSYLAVLLTLSSAALLGFAVLLGVRRARRPALAPAPASAVPVVQEKVRLPQIDTNTCLGCYACVDSCPYDVLAIERYVAVVVRPKDCCGLTLCAQVCPNGSLSIFDGEAIEDRPRLSESLESVDQPGVYLAGDLTGAPLIRSAIHQGSRVVQDIATKKPRARGESLDLVIVGAGPAGISAALEAKKQGLRYEVLEQASVAESIRSFPRGKLVFDQPVSMPLAGDLWLEESTKEELLGKWLRIVRREQLRIRERHRVTQVSRAAGAGFAVSASEEGGGDVTLHASRVVLAIGRRGTPRKLAVPLPDAALDRVHYSLADARSHAGADAIVVGLGDVAMEAAIALAHQPSTRVTIVYRGEGFSRGKARNAEEVQRLVREGKIDLLFSATVTAVSGDEVSLGLPEGARRVPYDALFVMIGSLPPWPFLEAAGVRKAGAVDDEDRAAPD